MNKVLLFVSLYLLFAVSTAIFMTVAASPKTSEFINHCLDGAP